jgi:predicted ATPase/DNA-binding CsgD family transcriptional regulator
MPDATREPPEVPGEERGRLIEFPRRPEVSSPPQNNLPLQLTSFVGRGREVAEVERLLVTEARLLTLTGAGGSGKTRLALAVAYLFTGRFEDGVWWVELAPISDPALVPQAVAQAMMIREKPGQPLIETLARDLAQTELLLVLDNCEHLIEASADLAETLLRACPGIRLLATSRESLGVHGEAHFVVPPLSLPDPLRLQDVDGPSRYEASNLFVQRARLVKPGFSLTEGNALAVAQVCHRLDGMPLAIELAAAKMKVLSVEQIASRLDDRFALLTGGGRTTLAHHGTLRATMQWSYDLLSEEEKTLFRRLCVFAGGFTLEAVETVCSGDGIQESRVLELLASLVEKSLVIVTEQPGEARYGFLETVKQYALDRLEESGEAGLVRERHVLYYLALAEKAEHELRGMQQGVWLEWLDREYDNLRSALSWTLEGEHAELALRLGGALGEFWHVLGHQNEARRWLEAALAKGEGAPIPVRAKALVMAGHIAWEQGDYERSVVLSEEGLALFREIGDDAGAVVALYVLGAAALFQNDLERATILTEEAVTLQRASGDSVGMARSLPILGAVAQLGRDYERAVALHEEGVSLAREAGDDFAVVVSLVVGASAYLGLGEHRRVRELYEEGLNLSRDLKLMHLTASNLNVAAALAGSQGQAERSARLWGAAEALREAIGVVFSPFERSYYEPYIIAAKAKLDEAAWEAAWAEGRAMAPEKAVEYALDQEPVQEEPSQKPSYPEGLSTREVDVLRLAAQGMTNARIAQELFVSPRTVNWHLGSVYRKLGTSSRSEAVRFAAEHNLLH